MAPLEINGVQGRQFIVLKTLHTVILLLSFLVMIVLAYASLKADTSENTRRIQEIENRRVDKEAFDEFRTDTKGRLERIEQKIDKIH